MFGTVQDHKDVPAHILPITTANANIFEKSQKMGLNFGQGRQSHILLDTSIESTNSLDGISAAIKTSRPSMMNQQTKSLINIESDFLPPDSEQKQNNFMDSRQLIKTFSS